MGRIRITEVPPGEAPLEIRQAWVGLVLPLAVRSSRPSRVPIAGVLSGPKSLLGMILNCFKFRRTFWDGYPVNVLAAIEVLEKADPKAAAWWRHHAPHLLSRWRRFVFPANCCQLLEGTNEGA
jgi:hypothetical protein